MRRALLGLLAGVLTGLPQVVPQAWPAAWLGAALLAATLSRSTARSGVLVALLWGLARLCTVIGWMWPAFTTYLDWPAWRAGALWAGLTLPMALAFSLPVALGATLRGRVSVALWLPLAWALGEAWASALGLGVGQLLDGQWRAAPVLRAVGWLGWTPSLVWGLFAASALGLASRRRQWLAPVFAVMALFAVLPPLPAIAPTGVGVVQMANFEDRPTVFPSVDLLVWPEGASRRRPHLEEGPCDGQAGALPGDPREGHLIGLDARGARGLFNAVVATDPSGHIHHMRAKRTMVPAAERRFLGVQLAQDVFQPGRASSVLPVGQRRVIALICYEVFDRSLIREDADLIAVITSDRVMAHSAVGRDQSLAALVLRAVETGLPAVRASMWGRSAIIWSDGSVHHEGILRGRGARIATGDRPKTTAGMAMQ